MAGILRVQSGAPWHAREPRHAGRQYLNYLEPAGIAAQSDVDELRSAGDLPPALQRADVAAASKRACSTLFGNQTQLSTDARQFLTGTGYLDAAVHRRPLEPEPAVRHGRPVRPAAEADALGAVQFLS